MANYKSGLFMGGMAEGISEGISWGTQILNIRERKKAKDAAKKLQEKINAEAAELSTKLDNYGKDNLYSETELLDLRTMVMSSSAEIQERFKPVIENIEKGNTKTAEEQIKMIDEYSDYLFNLNLEPGQVEQSFNAFKESGVVTSEQATRYFDAQENILNRKLEAREMQPEQGEQVSPLQANATGEANTGVNAAGNSKWQEFYDTYVNKQETVNDEASVMGYDEQAEKEVIQQDLQRMTEEQLYRELQNWQGMEAEAYYKLLYEEAKRRGFVQ